MKRLSALLLALFFCLSLPLSAWAAVPQVDPAEKVYDLAGLLTQDEADRLAAQAKDIAKSTGLDIAIVTTDTLNGMGVMAYADDFYDYNNFGRGFRDHGLLLVVCMSTRDIWITTHGKGVRYFYDADIDRVLNTIAPYLTQEEYYTGLERFLSESRSHIEASKGRVFASTLGTSLLFALLITGAVMGGMLLVHKKALKKAPGAHAYLSAGGVNITHRRDIFTGTHTTRTAIPKSTSSGGGGGGSTHRSSSGRSHGGGGRKF